MKKTVLITGILTAVLVIAGLSITNRKQQQQSTVFSNSVAAETPTPDEKVATGTGVQKGQLAPDFELTTIDNVTVKLSQFKGNPVIFSFVQTTGCAPCAIEAENIRKVQESKPNLKVIQVAIVDMEPRQNLANFRDYLGKPEWLIGYDKPKVVTELYKVRNIDTTVMVDAEGTIIYRDEGHPAKPKELLAALNGQQ